MVLQGVHGTELARAAGEAHGDRVDGEFHSTDQERAFIKNKLIGGKYLGAVADLAARIALNTSQSKGCWPGDFCKQSDTGQLFICATNHGALDADWIPSSLQVDTDSLFSANSDTRLASQKAIKTYVDALVNGLAWKAAVRVATTGNITLSGAQTIDGVAVVAGNRVLVKDQSTGSQNGIYLCASGAWTRPTDCDSGAELVLATCLVSEGTTNGNTQWSCTNDSITLGSTSILFAQIAGGSSIIADGTTLQIVGGTISVKDIELLALAGLTSAADKLPYFTGLGTASLATFTSFGRTLAALADAVAARTALGLGGAALLNVGTGAGQVAAGDDSRFGGLTGITGIGNLLFQFQNFH